jgi:urease accessory protein UreF
MARQMATLLVRSDAAELEEVVARWVAEAPTERVRQQYRQFGSRLLELKRALSEAPVQPSLEELELALTMMLRLAADAGPDAKPTR